MRKTTAFRRLIEAPGLVVLPGAHDALSARIIHQAGFEAYTAGGYSATATLLGAPDSSQLSMTEMADHYARLADASPLPVMADGDTGFGNSTNAARTVRAYERAGVASLFIEDQVYPKRCGHTPGKAIIAATEMVEKLKAALDARIDPDLIIMARTDALEIDGLDAALERAHLYCEAGADMIFVEALGSIQDMRRVCREVDAPCLATRMNGGLTPDLSAAEFQELGFAALALPAVATYAVGKTLTRVLAALARDDTHAEAAEAQLTFAEFNALIGLDDLRNREDRYRDQARALARATGAEQRADQPGRTT